MKATTVTNGGGCERNSDFLAQARAEEICCFALCDAEEQNDDAACLCAQSMVEKFKESPALSEGALYEYMSYACERLRYEGRYDNEVRVSAVMLLTDGKKAVWGHLGNSRLYWLRRSLIREVTSDHTMAFADYENREIEYEDIRKSPNRDRLLKYMGSRERFRPEVSRVRTVNKNTAFLLCSDGFWEYVSEDEIEKVKKYASSPREWLKGMLEIYHSKPHEKPGSYSAAALMFNEREG